jgi:chemotaxis signal transduction protein
MFEAATIKEVLGTQKWLVVPHSSRGLLGLCAWHGRAIPVLDLPGLLGLREASDEPLQRTLIAECQGNLVAVAVNEVRAVTRAAPGTQRPAHVTALPFSNFELDDGKQVFALVDLEAVVHHLLGEVRELAGGLDEATLG